jgi:DNA replicative helicase MCM subunit Mcm2 (Cdc46/Mcm family)
MAQAGPNLLQRLRVRKADDEPLPAQLLRKYIAYARQYVHPVLSGAAGELGLALV